MIEYLESLGFSVELSVMERKYYGKEIFKYLNSKGITYITPVKGSKTLTTLKEEALKNPKKRAQTIAIRMDMCVEKGINVISIRLGFMLKERRVLTIKSPI